MSHKKQDNSFPNQKTSNSANSNLDKGDLLLRAKSHPPNTNQQEHQPPAESLPFYTSNSTPRRNEKEKFQRLKQAALAAKKSSNPTSENNLKASPFPASMQHTSVDNKQDIEAPSQPTAQKNSRSQAEIKELMKTIDTEEDLPAASSSDSVSGFVLIVEDDIVNSRLLQLHLQRHNLETHAARDGEEALRVVASLQPDLILLDLNLPSMSGFEVCEKIRKVEDMDDVPIIFLTTEDHEPEMLRAYELGADDYITKSDFKPNVLAAKIKKFLRRRNRHISQNVDTLRPGMSIDGRYELLREVGRGGMGMVYLVRHQRLGFTLALKAMNIERPNREKSLKRFRREVQSLAELHHPNLIRIHDCGNFGQIPYYVMEYVSGGSLYSKLQQQGAIDTREALSIAGKLAAGLQCAHDHRILHRDLKTENILFKRNNEPVLTDFGLVLNFADESKRLTKVGCVVGTPHYMSPEQITQPNDIDGRSDIFSLGIVLYEMLTGQNPLIEYNRTEVMIKIVTEDIPSPLTINPRIHKAAVKVCMRALCRKRNQRYPSALAMSLACEQALKSL